MDFLARSGSCTTLIPTGDFRKDSFHTTKKQIFYVLYIYVHVSTLVKVAYGRSRSTCTAIHKRQLNSAFNADKGRGLCLAACPPQSFFAFFVSIQQNGLDLHVPVDLQHAHSTIKHVTPYRCT